MKREFPIVNPEICLTCRACVGVCPTGAIYQLRREILINYSICNGCGICADWCPNRAINRIPNAPPARKLEAKKIKTPPHLADTYDIIIAGGGIAGLSTAIGAIQQNPKLNILVLEKKRKIGEDVNSSAGTWHFTLDLLPLTQQERSEVVLQKFTKFGISVEKESVVLDIGKAFLETIDLSRLQIVLSEKLFKLGVQIETNSFVEDVKKTDAGFALTMLSNGNQYLLQTKLLADSSGIDSGISRKLALHKSWDPNTIGAGAEYEMTWEGDPSIIWFVRMKHRNLSYAWSFPIGAKKSRVGVAALLSAFKDNKIPLQEELDLFLTSHFLIKENTGTKISKTNFKCGAYPMIRMSENIISSNFTRAGDAASQANPVLGEGIYYAIKYGLTAGRALAQAKDGTKNGLKSYSDGVLKDSKKFEEDKTGYTADYDAMVKKLNEIKDKLSDAEKWALLSFIMPLESDWNAKLNILIKLFGYKDTMRLAGSAAKRKIGKLL